MKSLNYFLILIAGFTISHCSSTDASGSDNGGSMGGGDNDGNVNTWLIPVNEVVDGGPGKDGIPSIDNPQFEIAGTISSMPDDDLIVGIKQGDIIKAYPHYILDWHEVVNDNIANIHITLSYCPLTGTAFAWQSLVSNTYSTFGVSGLLYNSNLILYDRETDSNWSQILQQCINGELIADIPDKYSVIETNWKTWKDAYPNSLVLTTNTGFDKPYETYPYGGYKTNHDFFIFTPSPLNPALPNKQRIFAIINNTEATVFQFSAFTGGNVIRDNLYNIDHLIVGNENLIVAFQLNGPFSDLTFTYEFTNSEVFFRDSEGNKWNMFGEAIEGPRTGQKMSNAQSVTSMWFAIAAFYPNPTIN